MSAGAVVCPSCGYENIVVGCGFCLQCGTEFSNDAAIEDQDNVRESQITHDQPAASAEEPVASMANEPLVASTKSTDSQYVGFFDQNLSADGAREEVNVDPPIPSGGTEAFQSALLAAQQNDSFFADDAGSCEEAIGIAVENDEQPNTWQETVGPGDPSITQSDVVTDSCNSSMEQVESLLALEQSDESEPADEKTEPIVEAVQSAAALTDNTAADDATCPGAEPIEIANEAVEPVAEEVELAGDTTELELLPIEPADEVVEPVAEEVELAGDAVESELSPIEPADEVVELVAEEVELAGDTTELELLPIEPADEVVELVAEEVELAGDTTELELLPIEPADEVVEPVAEEVELAGDTVESELHPIEPADEVVEPVAEAVELTGDTVESELQPIESCDEVVELVVETVEPADLGVDPVDESTEPQAELAELSADLESTHVDAVSAAANATEQSTANAESVSDTDVTTELGEAEMVESISYSDSLALELDRLIAAAAKSIDMQLRSLEQGLVGELEIEGRKQHVYVQRNCSSNGAPLLSFFAACGPASHQHALPLLEWNSALPMCAFAIREIEDTLMFVVQANVPAFSLNQFSIAVTLKEIAKRADQVQQRIG